MLPLITSTHITHVQEQYHEWHVQKSILNQAKFLKERDRERERECTADTYSENYANRSQNILNKACATQRETRKRITC